MFPLPSLCYFIDRNMLLSDQFRLFPLFIQLPPTSPFPFLKHMPPFLPSHSSNEPLSIWPTSPMAASLTSLLSLLDTFRAVWCGGLYVRRPQLDPCSGLLLQSYRGPCSDSGMSSEGYSRLVGALQPEDSSRGPAACHAGSQVCVLSWT